MAKLRLDQPHALCVGKSKTGWQAHGGLGGGGEGGGGLGGGLGGLCSILMSIFQRCQLASRPDIDYMHVASGTNVDDEDAEQVVML